ncbi:MAG: hypothetical protein ACRC2B_24560, partial [Rubrivivax sp.]
RKQAASTANARWAKAQRHAGILPTKGRDGQQGGTLANSGRPWSAADSRQAPPARPMRPTAEQRIPVVWPRTSGVHRTAARRTPAAYTGTRPKPALRRFRLVASKPSSRLAHEDLSRRVLRPVGLALQLCRCQALAEVVSRFVFGSEPVSGLMMGMGLVALIANAVCLVLIA